jgi:hypothetical protein
MPGGEHKSQLPRGSHDQQLQLSQRLIRAQFVHIIDDQPDRVRQRGQVRQQPLDDRPPVQIWRRGHGLHQHRPRGRLTQRIQHRQPEPLRVSHTAADRHPRNTARQPQLATPRAKQHRLAAARRSRHHRHPARRREPAKKPGASDDSSRTGTGGIGQCSGRLHGRDHRTPSAVCLGSEGCKRHGTIRAGCSPGRRPPYGYRLADAGPDPNKAYAAWGRCAHRLESDPGTAHVVTWMFAQPLEGHSVARIARALNEAAIPCPSAADPDRNPHRPGRYDVACASSRMGGRPHTPCRHSFRATGGGLPPLMEPGAGRGAVFGRRVPEGGLRLESGP